MKIFDIQNGNAHPTVEILLIDPFSQIWERDLHKHKGDAIREFSYIEFMVSPKKTNPFWGYLDLKIRSTKIIEKVFSGKHDWKPDELIEQGIVVYKQWMNEASPSLSYLDACMEGIRKVQEFFNTVDLNAKTGKGALLYKPRDITVTMADTEKVIKSLNALREKVEQELFDAGKTLKNRIIGEFEE